LSGFPTLLAELVSGDDERAEAAALQIAAFGVESLPVLNILLSSPNPDARWWATRTLATIDDRSTTPMLLKALRDPDDGVRMCAAVALRERPDPTATPALITLLGSRNPTLGRLAADALVAIGKAATPSLVAVFENGSQAECLNAVRALSKIGDARAIPALFKALDHDSVVIQHLADKGLENLGVSMSFFEPD
jgi:HEAT repeat protein